MPHLPPAFVDRAQVGKPQRGISALSGMPEPHRSRIGGHCDRASIRRRRFLPCGLRHVRITAIDSVIEVNPVAAAIAAFMEDRFAWARTAGA